MYICIYIYIYTYVCRHWPLQVPTPMVWSMGGSKPAPPLWKPVGSNSFILQWEDNNFGKALLQR